MSILQLTDVNERRLKMFNKKIGMLVLSSVCLMGLASCGGEAGDSVETLTVSGPAAQGEFIAKIGEEYNAQREAKGLSRVTIKVTAHEENSIDSDITNWQDGPDVFAFGSDKTQEIFKKGGLSPVVGENAQYVKDNNTDAAVVASTFAGKLYSYPYTGDNGYFLMYNKKYFKGEDAEKYKSVEGIFEVCEKNNKKFGYPLSTAYYGAGALYTFGADYSITFKKDGSTDKVEADFDSQKGIDAGKIFLTIMNSAYWEDTNNVAPGVGNDLVASIEGSWNVAKFSEQMGNDFGCAKMPTITIAGHEATTIGSMLGYKLMGVNGTIQDADKLALAHDFAKFMTSPKVQEERFDALSVGPTAKSVVSLQKVQDTPHIKALADQGPYARTVTVVPANIWKAPATFAESVKNKEINESNLAEAMKTLNDSIKASK